MKGEDMNTCGRLAMIGRRLALGVFVISVVAAAGICVIGCAQDEDQEQVSVKEYMVEQAAQDAQQASRLPAEDLDGVMAQVDGAIIVHEGAERLGSSQEYGLLSYYLPQKVTETEPLIKKDFERLGWKVVQDEGDGYCVFEGGDETFNRVLVNFYESDAGSTVMAEFINWQSL